MASDKKIILITGANSGIGYDTSYALANASPNNHIIMGCRSSPKGEKALAEIQARKPAGTLSFLELDVSKDSSIAAAVKQIEAGFGVIDVLVNNAGICPSGITREIFRETFETNLFGAALLGEALVPLLKKSKDPRIINVTSGLGSVTLRGDPTNPHYQVPCEVYRMSKAALNMLTSIQYYNFRDWGCKVWAYCPGYVVTNLGVSKESDIQYKKDTGAESSETSAQGILEIVRGDRDKEVNGFVTRYGGSYPW